MITKKVTGFVLGTELCASTLARRVARVRSEVVDVKNLGLGMIGFSLKTRFQSEGFGFIIHRYHSVESTTILNGTA